MKFIVVFNIVSICLVAFAALLVITNKGGWGWPIAGAIFLTAYTSDNEYE